MSSLQTLEYRMSPLETFEFRMSSLETYKFRMSSLQTYKLSICILFYSICHTIITKNKGKEEKKKWRGDLTETIGAYERLGLLEL